MPRYQARLPVQSSKVLNNDGSFADAQRRFLIEVEKVTRLQLPNQPALDSNATLQEVITAFNLLIANAKADGTMEKD